MNTEEQIQMINETINKTKERLKPLGFNLMFWGLLVISMSAIHISFPEIIQQSKSSALIYWTVIPILGSVYTIFYNIKNRNKAGYQTFLDRSLKIIWSVFNFSWIAIVIMSFVQRENPVPDILFILSMMLIISGWLIKYAPVIIGGVLLMIFVSVIAFFPIHNFLWVNIIGLTFGMLVPGISLYYGKK